MDGDDVSKSTAPLVEALKTGRKKLVDVIEELRPFVTSDDALKRESGLDVYCSLIKQLPRDFLQADEVQLLTKFLIVQLECAPINGGSVVETLRHMVCNAENFSNECATLIIQDLFLQGNIQSWPQRTRADFYTIFETLVNKFEQDLKALGPDVTSAFISAMDGERDPRCLVQVFRIHRVISSRFPIESLAEDLFEVIACYYPIEFNPLPGQEQITSQMLQSMVEACFLSNVAFAPYLFVMIEEKLRDEETSEKQKETICALLAQACSRFSSAQIVAHLEPLLATIRMVALNPKEKAQANLNSNVADALVALFTIVQTVPGMDLHKIVKDFLQDCEPFVVQVEMGLQTKALNLLETCLDERLNSSSTNERVGAVVLEYIISWLVLIVRGETINVAANKAECIGEALSKLAHFVRVGAERKYEDILIVSKEAIFEGILRARDWVPMEANIAKFECLQALSTLLPAHQEFLVTFGDELRMGIRLVDTEKERREFLKFATSFARNATNWNDVWSIVEEFNKPRDFPKLFATICAVTVDEHSWQTTGKRIVDLLNFDEFPDQVTEILALAARSDEKFLVKLAECLIEFILKQHDKALSDDLVDLFSTSLQELGIGINEAHSVLSHRLVGLFDANPLNQRLFCLFVAQTMDLELLGKLTNNERLELDVRLLFFYSFVNKGRLGYKEALPSFVADDLIQYCTYFIKAALLDGPWKERGEKECIELLHQIADGKLATNGTELIRIIFDFTSPRFDPIRGKFYRNVLYRQRVFFLFLNAFNTVVGAQNDFDSRFRLVAAISPFLQYAKGTEGAGEALESLLPLLTNALADPRIGETSDERREFLASLVSLLGSSKLADKNRSEVEVLVAIFGKELQNNPKMGVLLDCLDGLELLVKGANPVFIQPQIARVVLVLSRIVGHKKRIVRQKAAKVMNL